MVFKLPREEKEALIERIRLYFEEERSETIGRLAAEQLLDWMLGEIGPYAYNQGVEDARVLIAERSQSLDDELYALKRIKPAQRR
ncbi:DUF2164 domain-containing protein [Paenibacillus cisolokensis]|uniref:DUF2164 domain-containing protein n=1 Tax=Paenibacillus cisolokensis TaxID=1658519 RepID=A0ABQ4N5L0_9BACL|nr:DUF2164 domain-containing protein [Paenibacillus cisolokensis]GIQ63478.1 hypothetical protein PACILC2_20460 [Paenibacillus cisolokensis]